MKTGHSKSPVNENSEVPVGNDKGTIFLVGPEHQDQTLNNDRAALTSVGRTLRKRAERHKPQVRHCLIQTVTVSLRGCPEGKV